MKLTFYNKNGKLLYTLYGGTRTHMKKVLDKHHFHHVSTHNKQLDIGIYRTQNLTGKKNQPIIAVVQPIRTTLVPLAILTKHLP